MPKSKASRIERFDFGEIEVRGDSPGADFNATAGKESANYISEQLKAITQRRAGRINALSISKEEERSLLSERKALLEKKYRGDISKSEQRRLELIRWSLDRIDDARSGEIIDALEGAIVRYEALREEISSLMRQLDELTVRGSR